MLTMEAPRAALHIEHPARGVESCVKSRKVVPVTLTQKQDRKNVPKDLEEEYLKFWERVGKWMNRDPKHFEKNIRMAFMRTDKR